MVAWLTAAIIRPSRARPPHRRAPHSHRLWTLRKADGQVRCDLRNEGPLGWETRLYRDGAFYGSRRFTTREQAEGHAAALRRDLEREGWRVHAD